MDLLSLLPVIVTVTAGVLGAFFAKNGERTKVGGIGWVLVGFVVISGLISVGLDIRKSGKARLASEEAARVEADNRRLQLRQVALLTSTIGGFDLDKPLNHAVFGLDMPVRDGEVERFESFVGPFPVLDVEDGATLTITIPDLVETEFHLSRAAPTAVQLTQTTGEQPPTVLTQRSYFADFITADASMADAEITESRPYVWASDPLGNEFAYTLSLPATMPARALISRLAQADSYGALTIRMPGLTDTERRRITATYAKIRPFFVFLPQPLNLTAEEEGCVSRIHVPLRFEPAPKTSETEMTFNIQAEPKGFDTVICGWVP